MRERYLKRNITLFYIYNIFIFAVALSPVFSLFFLEKGLSFTDITLLQSTAYAAMFLFEVPSGVISDKFGRKRTLFLASFLILLAYILLTSSNTHVYFLAVICSGLGLSAMSGTDYALIYDTLKELGREDEYRHIIGRAKSLSLFLGTGVTAVLGGFLFKININYPLYLTLFTLSIPLIVSLFYIEPHFEKSEHRVIGYFKEGIKIVINKRNLIIIFLLTALFNFIFKPAFWMYSPYMENIKIPIQMLGGIFFSFNVVAALSAHFFRRIHFKRFETGLILLIGLMIVSFISLGSFVYVYSFGFIYLQQIARGAFAPVITPAINEQIDSKYRATIMSMNNFSSSLLSIFTFPLIGIIVDQYGIVNAHSYVGVVTLVTLIIIYIIITIGRKE